MVPSPFPGPTSPSQPFPQAQNHPGTFHSAGYSQNYTNAQPAFSSQLDMAQSQGSGRGGPYNMNAMMNALPQQQQYRSGQYPQNQQRFSPPNASSSTMQNHMPLPQQQFEAQGGINPMANQQYYLPQHGGGMPQYYSTSMTPPHSQTNLPTRNNMGYYPSPAVMTTQQASAPATYYYPQPAQYGTPPSNPMAAHLMPVQYLSSIPPQSDHRMAAALPTDQFDPYGRPYIQSRGSSKFLSGADVKRVGSLVR